MKNSAKLFGIIALVAVVAFAMIACSDGGSSSPGSDPTSATYTSYDSDGVKYDLVITKGPNRAAFSPQAGDTYKLTITLVDGTKHTSTGTVKSVSGNDITLENSGTEFTVTIDGTSIKSFSDDPIPVEGGGTVNTPVTLTPTKPGNGGTPIVGAATLTFSGQVYTEDEEWYQTAGPSITYTKFTGNMEDIIGHGTGGAIGGSGKITNGVLSFTIGTPDSLVAFDDFVSGLEEDGYINVIASKQGVEGVQLERLLNNDKWNESLYRENIIVSNASSTKCSYNAVQVVYIYVDADVTVSAKGYDKSGSGTAESYGFTHSWSETYSDLNLQLKKGWNSVCIKEEGTETITGGTWDDPQSSVATYTITISQDNPDLKWVL